MALWASIGYYYHTNLALVEKIKQQKKVSKAEARFLDALRRHNKTALLTEYREMMIEFGLEFTAKVFEPEDVD